MTDPVYEVLAVRYATHRDRTARSNFIFVDAHDTLMPLDYYVWVIRGPIGAAQTKTIVVDTGFGPESAARRPGRVILTPVEAALRAIDVDAGDVADVVITHMHFDHAGNLDLFPKARFHIQDAEMAYCTGRCMCHEILRGPMYLDDVLGAVRRVYAGQFQFHNGTSQLMPGITLHLIGGHTGGLQAVRVRTKRGWIVLASDATHYWANIRGRSPFPLVADVAQMMEGYRILEQLADGPDHIIPGHDPLVRERFPPVNGNPEAVRLDVDPVGRA